MGVVQRLLDSLPFHSPAPVLRRVQAVINPAAGSVGPGAEREMQQILSEAGLDHTVVAAAPESLPDVLRAAVDAAPDLLIVLAGDGTARAAASLCGPRGPLLAPLAGGTMNVLPHAIYGSKPWQQALNETLADGISSFVSGGEVDRQRFYVAAILGGPALFAEAREAARAGLLRLAWRKTRSAMARAFSSKLSYQLEGGEVGRAEALALLCPLVSRAMADDERALEAAALNPRGAAEAVRLGFRTMFSDIVGDWRLDSSVDTSKCRRGGAWAHRPIPVIVDGEPMRLHKHVDIRFVERAFRAYAPARQDATVSPPAK